MLRCLSTEKHRAAVRFAAAQRVLEPMTRCRSPLSSTAASALVHPASRKEAGCKQAKEEEVTRPAVSVSETHSQSQPLFCGREEVAVEERASDGKQQTEGRHTLARTLNSCNRRRVTTVPCSDRRDAA